MGIMANNNYIQNPLPSTFGDDPSDPNLFNKQQGRVTWTDSVNGRNLSFSGSGLNGLQNTPNNIALKLFKANDPATELNYFPADPINSPYGTSYTNIGTTNVNPGSADWSYSFFGGNNQFFNSLTPSGSNGYTESGNYTLRIYSYANSTVG